jgi:hypothetical protein
MTVIVYIRLRNISLTVREQKPLPCRSLIASIREMICITEHGKKIINRVLKRPMKGRDIL